MYYPIKHIIQVKDITPFAELRSNKIFKFCEVKKIKFTEIEDLYLTNFE